MSLNISISDFSFIFLCKNCNTTDEGYPLIPNNPPLKIETLSSSPFSKFGKRLTLPPLPPQQKGRGVHTMKTTLKNPALLGLTARTIARLSIQEQMRFIFLRMLGQNLKSTYFLHNFNYYIQELGKQAALSHLYICCTNNFSYTTSHSQSIIFLRKNAGVGYIFHCFLEVTLYK